MLAKDKRSSLLQKVVTYGRKKLHNIGPRSYQPSLKFLGKTRGFKFFVTFEWAQKQECLSLVSLSGLVIWAKLSIPL